MNLGNFQRSRCSFIFSENKTDPTQMKKDKGKDLGYVKRERVHVLGLAEYPTLAAVIQGTLGVGCWVSCWGFSSIYKESFL